MSTVLVAEDDPGVRELIRTALTLAGHEVLVAADGDEAWGVLRQRSVQALVVDLHLPGRDGLALVAGVRRDAEMRGMAVVVVTGDAGVGSAADDVGADAVVQKPFTIRGITGAVSGAIAARAPADAPA